MVQVRWMRGWWPLAGLTLLWGVFGQAQQTGRDMLEQPRREGEVRGIWFFRSQPTDWDAVMQELRHAGLNSVFVRVGRGGNVIYPSQVLPTDAWARELGHDELKAAIDAAHRQGLDFHAWRVTYHMGSAPEEYRQRLAEEDRLVRDPEGQQARWANPADPRNFDTELKAFIELVGNYEVDGVHFDYIRYPDDPGFDYDYGPVSQRRFQEDVGFLVQDWPADVIDGTLRLVYEDWCRRQVDQLVEAVHREVKARKPWVQISAAVWRNHHIYSTIIKQNWPMWIEKGWLDFAVPMDYTADPEDFTDQVRQQVSLTRGRAGMVIGMGSWRLETTDAFLQQIDIVRRHGADGFVLFSYNAEQIEDQFQALREGPGAVPAEPAYNAPAWRVDAPAAVEWTDEPLRVIAGRTWDLTATLRPRRIAPSPVTRIAGRVHLEDGFGEDLGELATVDADGEETLRLRTAMPEGYFQLVLRGYQRLQDGTEMPFVARGPLMLGTTAEEYRAYQDRYRVPRPAGPGLRVGVWYDGWSSDNIMSALEAMPGMAPVRVYRLLRGQMQNLDALILPGARDLRVFWNSLLPGMLRNWTAEGHVLVLGYDAVGVRWHPRLFPEIGLGLDRVAAKMLRASTPVEGVPDAFQPGYGTYARLQLEGDWQVWVTEDTPEATPVVAETRWGQGRLVLWGTLLGGGDGPVSEPESALLTAVLRPE